MLAVTPAAVTLYVPHAPVTNETRLVDSGTVANADMCLPMNHIQLRQSDKRAQSAITSYQADDKQGKIAGGNHIYKLDQMNVLTSKP